MREPVAAMRALWSALDAAATPASTLAILAALVRTLSASDYGILVIAFAASGLSMAVNPAIAATTTKFVSELSGRRDPGGRTVAGVITVSLLAVAAIDLVLFLGTAVFNKPLSQWVFGAPVARPPLSRAHRAGFIVNPVAPDAIRLAPPLVVTTAELDLFVDALPGLLDTATADATTKDGR